MLKKNKRVVDLVQTRKNEIFTYLRALKKNDKIIKNKFFIFAHYRTGSTLLKSLLNSHPEIKCDGEIFLPFIFQRFKKVLFPNFFIENKLIGCREKNYGFVLRLSQLEHILTRFHTRPDRFVENLFENGWKIIHLKRENFFKQALSNIIQIKRGQSHDTFDNPLRKTHVQIFPQELIRSIRSMENYSRKEDDIMEKIDHLKIVYENDLLDSEKHQETSDKIFSYLGIDKSTVKTNYRKVSSDNIGEYIENFDALLNFIKTTNYSKFLDC